MEKKKPFGIKTREISILDDTEIRAGDAYLMRIKSSENDIVIGFCDEIYQVNETDPTTRGAHFIFRSSSNPDTITEMNIHVDEILSGEVEFILHYSAECYERHAYAIADEIIPEMEY